MTDILGVVVTGCAVAAEERRLNCAWLAYFEAFDIGANFSDDT